MIMSMVLNRPNDPHLIFLLMILILQLKRLNLLVTAATHQQEKTLKDRMQVTDHSVGLSWVHYQQD